jgi:para-nitrobenzyl esterase
VNIGYRLGVEGFLEMEGAPSNRAVLDWIAALEWVQENIASFGGDPRNVTIGGQSAGSAACLILLVNPRAKDLFGRVIAMSGTSDSRMPRESAVELGRQVAEKLGVRATRDDLGAFSAEQLVEAHAAVAANPFARDSLVKGFDPKAPALRPFVDGEVIAEHPFRAIAQGAGGDVPLLAGSTAHEINGVVRMQRATLEGETAARALSAMGLEGERLDRYKRHVGSDDAVEVLAQASTDRAFREPLARLLEDHAGTGAPTFAYQFRWRTPAFDGFVGSAHCFDIPFAFDNLDAERVADGLIGPTAPQELADVMHDAWVSFIKTGEPGWPAYDRDRRAVMVFDSDTSIADDPLRVEREVFKR